MCGIAGFCDFQEDFLARRDAWQQVLVDMREAIAHRGPDQAGEYLRENVGLSHARLSIRDLAGGAQPMVRRAGGAEYGIVYNGEVYNTRGLTADLAERGYRMETTSDTEVILGAYMAFGPSFVTRLNGIFAFAIWDGARQTLQLYRDRLGVKPLFYARRGDTLVFGSEPKALFRHPLVKPAADADSFREIFGIGPARTPGCGVFRDLHELSRDSAPPSPGRALHNPPIGPWRPGSTRTPMGRPWRKPPGSCGTPSSGRWSPTCRCAASCPGASTPAS